MATLQVLCPNGRRQNVKVTPNSKLLQVLEEVCQKQGFLPAEDYSLLHVNGRKTVDLTLAYRYCNLANNAKLELVKAKSSRAEEEVLIALQLEDGSRLQSVFKPSVTLWDILSHWENESNSSLHGKLTMIDTSVTPVKHPVCIYMREEVIGEMALRNTTLRKLALTGGKAAIRLVHRSVDDGTLAKVIQDVELTNAKKAKLEEIASQKLIEQQSETGNMCVNSGPTASKLNAESSLSHDQQEPMETDSESNTMQTSSSSSSANVNNRQTNFSDSNMTDSINSNQRDSAICVPDSRPISVNRDNSINRLREMNIPGVEIFTPQDFADLTPEEQVIATRLAQRFVPGLMRGSNTSSQSVTQSRPRSNQYQPSPRQNFNEFKFPEETKGKEVYKNELSEVKREEFQPCDRESILYCVEETLLTSKSASQELPDDFFEINENDLRIMMTDLQKNVENMEGQGLMTKAMRQAALEARYEKYERVVIRIQFPNKLVLQALFRPKETVYAVQKYVKENLEDKNMPFYLYTTPPKTILKDKSQTLLLANLVPATLIYFGTEAEHDNYLTPAIISCISPRIKAEELAAKWLQSDNMSSSSTTEWRARPSTSSTGGASTSSTGSEEKKMPKWLKLGKK
ncbi:hypothetical protein SNE40_018802 [Patella caerulea]|uniref:UBX domain-containing protein n=1 Tax=Patella caerulea TaxID=87958 RepID=A0AAN8P4L1_PATCE